MGRFANAFSVLLGPSWYHFTLIYSDSHSRRERILLRVSYGIGITIILFLCTPWFIPSMGPAAPYRYYPFPGPLYVLYTLLFMASVALAFQVLIRKMKADNSEAKSQTLGLMAATLAGFVGGTLTFLPIYRIEFPQYGVFAMPLYPFIFSYFISRKNLFSLENLAMAMHQEKLMEMGILSASINHELKSPLYVIKTRAESFLERRKEGSLNDLQAAAQVSEENFKIVQEQSQRMFQIMSRLKTFITRKAEDKPVMALTKISDILDQLEPLLGHHLMTKNIELVCDIHPNAGEIMTDAGYLEEILFNLLVNASQALKDKKEGGKVIVRSRFMEGKKRIEVEDNGPGIPADSLKRIFKPFYTTKEQGVGLGLYITSRLAERMGTKLTAANNPAGGAIFRLEFPSSKG